MHINKKEMPLSTNGQRKTTTDVLDMPSPQYQRSVPVEHLHDWAVGRCVGENGPHEHVRAPQLVSDHLAAAQVLDLEAQFAVPLVRLKQRVVGVRAEELGVKTARRLGGGSRNSSGQQGRR